MSSRKSQIFFFRQVMTFAPLMVKQGGRIWAINPVTIIISIGLTLHLKAGLAFAVELPGQAHVAGLGCAGEFIEEGSEDWAGDQLLEIQKQGQLVLGNSLRKAAHMEQPISRTVYIQKYRLSWEN